MHSESTSDSNSGRFLGWFKGNADPVDEQPVVAGRLEWVTTVPREQFADLATRSRTIAGTARTRVTPVRVTPVPEESGKRFRKSKTEESQKKNKKKMSASQTESTSSTPWMLIAVLAALVSVVVFIAARRSRQRAEEEAAFDLIMESDMLPPEQQPMHTDHGIDSIVSPNP